MKQRVISIILVIGMLLTMLSNAAPVRAEDPFPSPDMDGDALSNDMETAGWSNLAGGPYITGPLDADSDDDGLTDGEEKLFDSNPLDSHSPGIAVRYDNSFKTRQYFRTADPAYLAMKQGGNQYLLTEALVARRGTSFNIIGPATGTLAITGDNMTVLNPVRDPARGGWTVTLPPNGTVGTYTATITDGDWTVSMPLYVIFQLPTDLPEDQVAAFLYDDSNDNKKDEVAVFWRMGEWPFYGNQQTTIQPCPGTDPNAPCSNWQYHLAYGYAQAYWTEQFTKSAFVDHAIKAIHGKTTVAAAVPAAASWIDYEFRTRSGRLQNNWSSSIYRWNDGTGITMSGGYCETTSTTYTTILRSAGIAARPFALDYNKTTGHGESGQIGTQFEYDHAVMMWIDGVWKAQRAYGGDEVNDLYYPWNSGTTGISLLKDWDSYSGYYTDRYGDGVFAVNEDWDFQNGSNAGGTVNTVWQNGVPSAEFAARNRDYVWDSRKPLEIVQSPHVDVLNCQMWKGDNWAPGEWRTPILSNPAGRDETMTYILPAGVPDPATPLENWPYNPRPTSCSTATPAAVCTAFRSTWSTSTCTIVAGTQAQTLPAIQTTREFHLYLPGVASAAAAPRSGIQLGNILDERSVDENGDGLFDKLIVRVEVISSVAGQYQFGGVLRIGDEGVRGNASPVTIEAGKQVVEIAFDGLEIGSYAVDGPYKITTLWAADLDENTIPIADPEKMLDYEAYGYNTRDYTASQFQVVSASIADKFSYTGVDENGNGLYESILVDVDLNIELPGQYMVEGDLYARDGAFIGHATWEGSEPKATLKFDVAKFQPPFTLEHLNLIQMPGPVVDSRYPASFTIADVAGRVEAGSVNPAPLTGVGNQPLDVDPNGSITFAPADTDSDGKYDKLTATVGVTVTTPVVAAGYKIEGLLVDAQGTPVAWASSPAKTLTAGTNRTLTLDFDGKMLFEQLPLEGSESFRLVAVKIYSGNLNNTTLESQVLEGPSTAAYSRSQFDPASPAVSLFQDDQENGTGKWSAASLWSQDTGTWNSYNHAWKASASGSANGELALAAPLNLSDYADPMLRFDSAYQMNSGSGKVEVSTNGTNWTTLATYTGLTNHWKTEKVDLSDYGEMANVQLRFVGQSSNGILWYVDDVFVNGWPAVKTASFTYPAQVVAGANTTLTASYTSIATNLPVTYKWNFCGVDRQVTTPQIVYQFPSAGNCAVTLTVQNPYDDAVAAPQTIYVNPASNQFTLNVNITPAGGGTVTKSPDRPAYNPGEKVTLTATPATGYSWTGWSGGGCTGTAPCTVTMNANTTVTANFTQNAYTLTINTTGTGSVTKNPNKATYQHGEVVELTAVPGTNWNFSIWGGALSGTTNPQSITMDGNKTVSATFVQGAITLTVNTVGNGTVTKTPDLAYYPENQVVSLAANPVPGWSFSAWSGGLTGSANPVSITMNTSKTVTATFTQDQYTFATNTVGQGTVAKSPNKATYTYGETVTVTATPATGWSFYRWSGSCTGTGACVVTVDGNENVTATFTQDQYTLTVNSAHGTVTKSPNLATYTYGTEVTLTMASVEPGWELTGWGVPGCTGTGPCTLTITGNTTVTPAFSLIDYTLTFTIVGQGNVTRSPNQDTYHYGDQVELRGVPDGGWSFAGWSGDLTGTTSPVTITVDGNKAITATFTEDFWLLTVNISGGGTVELVPDGHTLPERTPPYPYYTYHEMPNMHAHPNPGWTFERWSGDRTGTANPMAITMSANKTVTAHFTAIPYTFTTSVVGQGTITKSPEKSTYIYGDQVTVTATPAQGWRFKEWGGSCTGSGPCVVTVDGNENVTATFEEGVTTFSVNVTVTGSGTVTKSPDLANYPAGSTVQLTAAPAPGWSFGGWSGDATGMTNPITITVDGNKTINAAFTQNEYTLTVNTAGTGTVAKSPNQATYHYGDTVQLTPTAGSGFTFSGWSGDATGNANPLTVTVTKNMVITATFTPQQYTLTVNAGTGGSVTKSPDKPTYLMGETVQLKAVPGQHYNFTSWGGDINGSANPVDVVISGNMTVTASFAAKAYNLTVTVQPEGKGTVNATPGPYYYNTQVTLTAQATAPGWSFDHWTDGSTDASHIITITGDTTIGAVFTEDTYTLTVRTTGQGSTSIQPGGPEYHFGDMVTLTATPAPGWTFIRWEWTNGGSSQNPLTVEMTSDKVITAVFQQSSYTYNLASSIVGEGGLTVTVTPNPVQGWSFSEWRGDCTGSGPCVLELNGSKSVTAIFTQNQYTLDIEVTGAEFGTITSEDTQDTYLYGNVATLTAAPEEGYMVEWGGACSGTTGNTCTVTMTDDAEVTANFVQDPNNTGMLDGSFRMAKQPMRSELAYQLIPAL